MKRLRLVVAGKKETVFANSNITFVRGSQVTKAHTVPYTTGNGFQVADGTVLLTQGINNQLNYLNISVNGNQTISNTGGLNLLITRYPSATQANENKNIIVDGSTAVINFLYNSRPVVDDMEIEVDNRIDRVITLADFIPNVSDYDGDGIAFITIYNPDANLIFNGSPYVNGTPVSVTDLANGLLVYSPDDTDNQYNDDYDYTVTDTQGNISL